MSSLKMFLLCVVFHFLIFMFLPQKETWELAVDFLCVHWCKFSATIKGPAEILDAGCPILVREPWSILPSVWLMCFQGNVTGLEEFQRNMCNLITGYYNSR